MASLMRHTCRCNTKKLLEYRQLQGLKLLLREIRDKPSQGLKPVRPPSITTSLPPLESNSSTHCGPVNKEFHSEKVQSILERVTGMDLDKVFRARKEILRVPTYKLMTDEELLNAEEEIKLKASKYLEMPEVREERKPLNVVLSEDRNIDGFDEDNAKFVFVDISTDKAYRDRRIVVREPDGVLREATWPERDTLEVIYFPRPGLRLKIPAFLRDKHLPVMFKQQRHTDVLDFVYIQCLPDSPDYIRVHQRTYADIEKNQAYDLLRSTRHFGGLVYYLVKNKIMEGILTETLEQSLVEDAIDLVMLYHIIHVDADFNVDEDFDGIQFLRSFLAEKGMERAMSLLADCNLQRATNQS